jgi:hypothetical protein
MNGTIAEIRSVCMVSGLNVADLSMQMVCDFKIAIGAIFCGQIGWLDAPDGGLPKWRCG